MGECAFCAFCPFLSFLYSPVMNSHDTAVMCSSSNQRPIPPNGFLAKGTLKNFNTIEDFKKADKTAIFNDLGSSVRPTVPLA